MYINKQLLSEKEFYTYAILMEFKAKLPITTELFWYLLDTYWIIALKIAPKIFKQNDTIIYKSGLCYIDITPINESNKHKLFTCHLKMLLQIEVVNAD